MHSLPFPVRMAGRAVIALGDGTTFKGERLVNRGWLRRRATFEEQVLVSLRRLDEAP
jgi:hypothetical protein